MQRWDNFGNAVQRNVLGTGPDLQFVTLGPFPNIPAQALADQQLQLPKACKFIMLASITGVWQNSSLYMHFLPLGKTYPIAPAPGAQQINPTGLENWFPFWNGISSGAAMTKMGLYYKFKKPMPQTIYFDIGAENGAGQFAITFAVGNDVAKIASFMPNQVPMP